MGNKLLLQVIKAIIIIIMLTLENLFITGRSLFDMLSEWDVMLPSQRGYTEQDELGGVKRGCDSGEGYIVMESNTRGSGMKYQGHVQGQVSWRQGYLYLIFRTRAKNCFVVPKI